MKRMIVWAVLASAPLLAQTTAQTPAPDGRVNKLVTLKYVDPNSLVSIFNQWSVVVNPNNQTKTLALSGPADKVAAVEAAIRQLDVAAKNIDLTVYFVVGGDQANLAGGAIPQDLRDVITQLKGTFTFKEYRMLDVLTLRTRAGSSAETSGILNAANPPRMSQFSIRNSTVSEDGTIRIDRMHAGLRIPISAASPEKNANYINTGIDQDVDVKEGQKVVVGRSSLEGPQQALFLILTAHVIP